MKCAKAEHQFSIRNMDVLMNAECPQVVVQPSSLLCSARACLFLLLLGEVEWIVVRVGWKGGFTVSPV